MKKLFVLPLITLVLALVNLSSCVGQTNRSSNGESQQTKATESFTIFAHKFYSDATFQLSRVSFPVGEFYDFKKKKKVPYSKSNWKTLVRYKAMFSDEYPPFNKQIDGSYTYVAEMDGGAVWITYTFQLKDDGKWYLVKIITQSID